MQKIILSFIIMCFTTLSANASSITKTIKSLNINESAVSVSVRNISDGSKVYSLNDRVPHTPASTLKLVTSSAALDTLGADYEFTTKLYKSSNNDLYLKLGADPLLKSANLETLIKAAKDKEISPKNFYVDATIFDSVEWGEGWQWDDNLNPLMPKFSAYNLDGNLVNIEITPNFNGNPATIKIKPFYPFTIMNLISMDTINANNIVTLERNDNIAPYVICANGIIKTSIINKVPVTSPKVYFRLRLEEAIRNQKLDYYKAISYAPLPEKNIYLVSEFIHDIDDAMKEILQNSDNLIAETLFKLAGAKYSNSKGSNENSLNMLDNYFDKIGISTNDIRVVDGSGVSKNNIMTSDFMTDFLVKRAKNSDFEQFKTTLPSAGQGTLKNRMLYFKDNLRAKTGTLSDTSAIAGYITTRKGKTYAFDIMIKDAKSSSYNKKNLEEQILRQIYMNY